MTVETVRAAIRDHQLRHNGEAPEAIYLGNISFAEFRRDVAPMLVGTTREHGKIRPTFTGIPIYEVDADLYVRVV